MTTRPMLTQREAAAACGVSRTTIRRRREAGDLPGAVQDSARGWLIPVEDLLAAGFRLNAPAPPDRDSDPSSTSAGAGGDVDDRQEPGDVAALRTELERLRHVHALELANERHGRELAEAKADHLAERLREKGEHIEDLQRALAALMPAPERAELPPPPTPVVPGQGHPEPVTAGDNRPADEGRQRRWWHRR